MSSSRCRSSLFLALFTAAAAVFMAISISGAHAQESTPTPEPQEFPLVPTPMAPIEEPRQGLAQTTQSPSPSGDIVIDDEPDNSIRPVVAYSGTGDVYLAVWQDSLESAPTSIFARFVDAAGNPLGTRFLVVQERPGRVQVKVVAGGGVFFVVWREGQDPAQASLYVQRITASFSGSPLLGSPVLVHSPVENQFNAIFNPDRNEFLLTWLDPRNSVLASYLRGEVYGRIITPEGLLNPEVDFTPVPANPSITQILNAPAYQSDLSAACNPDLAHYLLTYGTYICTNISCTVREEVRGQRVDAASLTRLGNPVSITPNPARIQWAARALYDPRLAQYVVFWDDNRANETDFSIFAQRLTSQGSLTGANEAIVSDSGSQLWPEVVYLDADAPLARYFLAWEDDPGAYPHYARGAFLLEDLSVDGGVLDLSTGTGSSQQFPQVASDVWPVPSVVAVWQHTRPNQSADVHATYLSSLARYATVFILDDDGATVLPWDGLADTSVFVEARLPRLTPDHTDTLTAVITTQQSGAHSLVPLSYVGIEGAEHVYRSQRLPAGDLIDPTAEMTVAALVNAESQDEYDVATAFMDHLGVPEARRRGIAWGMGDESTDRAPASLEFFRSAGYEDASVGLLGYLATDEFFIANQAEVFLYIGEGYHDDWVLFLENTTRDQDPTTPEVVARPEDVGNAWNHVQVAILFGCSVLDINNYNGWAVYSDGTPDYGSPGKQWVRNVPGPDTWLGFQWSAPRVIGEHGDEVVYALADRVAASDTWVDAWRTATTGEMTTHKSITAVAIDNCTYYYWRAHFIFGFEWWEYDWTEVPCSEWDTSNAGLEITVASPVVLHVYDDEGRHVGPRYDGGYDTEIPGSSFSTAEHITGSGAVVEAERLSIRPADLSLAYEVFVVGTGHATFDMFVDIPDRPTQMRYEVAYIDVPVDPGAEYSLDLGPYAEGGFALVGFEGEVIQPTSVIEWPLLLPVNLTLSGDRLDDGWYAGSATATLSSSARPDLPQVVGFEYDLGDGWQVYEGPVILSRDGENLLRYRGVFADGSYDVPQEVLVRVLGANRNPTADAGADQVAPEGATVQLSASGSTDPDGDPLTYSWELLNVVGPDVVLSSTTDANPSFQSSDDAIYLFRVTVDDGKGGTSSDEVTVTIENTPPGLSPLALPAEPIPVGSAIAAASDFADSGVLDSHHAAWEWGDGTSSEAAVSETSGSGTAEGNHTYNAPGVYTITLTLLDDDGAMAVAEHKYLVVYDPTGGFVTAGGWFQSPTGSLPGDSSFTGRANFGLNARYRDGATTPSGQTQFSLQGGVFTFHSTSYEWLVAANGRAQYRGTGTIDGEGSYGFLITLIDGDASGGSPDRVRIKIWSTGTGEVIYDSQMGQPDDADPSTALDGGSIVLHE